MSKHTPGPWYIYEDGDSPGIEASACSIVVFGLEEDDGGVGGRTTEEAKANARLIAAAPDLLEALQHLMVAHGEQLDYAFQQAQDAIAKATGKKT